jgi:type IV secretory pathway VirB10-like protein
MTTETPTPEPAEKPLELAPRPPIRKLSSAIVWIAAIFAVAVLWLVGYLVSAKARRPAPERRVAMLPPQADDLAERIRQAAAREAKVLAQREVAEQEGQAREPRPLPPGFAELLDAPPTQPTPGNADVSRASSARTSTAPQASSVQRARDSAIVPASFRVTVPRADLDGGPTSGGMLPGGLPDLAALRADLLRAVEPMPAAAPTPATARPTPGRLSAAASPFTLTAGTLIPAILTAGINSELPGQTTALVRRNVYDSLTGRYLLLPQGSRLVGEYDSRVAYGQRRVLVAWHRLIFPDGRSLDLAGMPGVDLSAAAGLRDKVDRHFVRTFGGALLLAAVSAGVQLSQPDSDNDFRSGPTPSQLAAAAVGQELGRVATESLRREMDVRPTIEIRPGYELNVEVTSDLVLDGPYDTPSVPEF